jgi:hypothetical protein
MARTESESLSVRKVVTGFISLLAVLTTGTFFVSSWNPVFRLNENQILYLFSTSAQVIAAIYGLTLTGFIFFRNELSREEGEDETLSEAVEELKARYFSLLVFITVLVVGTLALANLAISLESQNSSALLNLVINGGQAAFFTSLAAVSYFIFDVISPRRIEKMSRDIQSRIDPDRPTDEKGSLENFLGSYNEIESLLQAEGKKYYSAAGDYSEQRYRKHFSNSRIAEVLFRRQAIDESLYGELLRLVTLRNSIIHGAVPAVSVSLVDTARHVLVRLKEALGRR